MQQSTKNPLQQRKYVAPDIGIVRAYGLAVCADLESKHRNYNSLEVKAGLTAFLILISQMTAKALNNGHELYLLKGYSKTKNR